MTEPHTHQEQPTHEAPPESGWTGYAAVKYGFILLIVIAILVFLALYVIPAFTD